jgi:hypothetical protein
LLLKSQAARRRFSRGPDMGDSSLIRATLLIALLAAVGFVAAGRAPAAESPAESPMAFDKARGVNYSVAAR